MRAPPTAAVSGTVRPPPLYITVRYFGDDLYIPMGLKLPRLPADN
jgi:hypothetical protein